MKLVRMIGDEESVYRLLETRGKKARIVDCRVFNDLDMFASREEEKVLEDEFSQIVDIGLLIPYTGLIHG